MNDSERLKKIITDTGLSIREFAAQIDCKYQTIYSVYTQRNALSKKVCTAILDRFPHINRDWLLIGIGQPYAATHSPGISVNVTGVGSNVNHSPGAITVSGSSNKVSVPPAESSSAELTSLREQLTSALATNETLRKENEWLRSLISRKMND